MTDQDVVKILVIEDDRDSRVLATESLSHCKSVQTEKMLAVDAASGVEKFIFEKPDITFLGIGMPDGNGLDLLALLLRKRPDAFIVVLTGRGDARHVFRAKEIGAQDYIVKPFNIQRFMDTFHVYFDHRNRQAYKPSIDNVVSITKEDMDIIDDKQQSNSFNAVNELMDGWSILFVDDYMVNRDNAHRQLAKLGCDVVTAGSGAQVKEQLAQRRFDMMFIDIALQDMNAYHLVRQLREQEKQTPYKTYVVGMLPLKDDHKQEKWMAAGMHEVIIKPCRFQDLESKARKYARRFQEDRLHRIVV